MGSATQCGNAARRFKRLLLKGTTMAHYDFSKWSAKLLGPKPTLEQQAVAHVFGKPGKQTLSVAMRLRDCGATAEQVKQAVAVCYNTTGTPQNNKPRDLLEQGWFKRVATPDQAESGHTVYRMALTPKGEARVKLGAYGGKAPDGDGKATKAKAKPAKARKPKPVKAPVDAPAPVSDGADTNPPVDSVQA